MPAPAAQPVEWTTSWHDDQLAGIAAFKRAGEAALKAYQSARDAADRAYRSARRAHVDVPKPTWPSDYDYYFW